MNQTDTLIINKFFPKHLRTMMMILATESNLLEKARKLLQRSIKESTFDNNQLPFDVDEFVNLLQREVTVPESSGKNLQKTSVFFGLTRRLRNNIIMFLNCVLSESSVTLMCIPSTLDSWNAYLEENRSLLDEWGLLLFESNRRKENCTEFKSILSNKCLQNLKEVGDKVNCKRFSVSISKEIPKKMINEENKSILSNNIPSMIPMDIDETCSNDILSATIIKTEQSIDSFEVSTNIDSYIERDKDDTSPNNGSIENFGVISQDSIENLKEKIYSLKDDTVFSPEFYQVFNDCPNNKVDVLCEELKLDLLPEEVLCSFVSNLFKQNELVFETSSVILYHCLTKQLNALTIPISRNIFTCICNNLQVNQRLMVLGVLTKLLDTKSFSSIQEDLLKKLVLNGTLKPDGVGMLLSKHFENETVSMTEEFVSLVEVLLNSKPSLSDSSLHNMIRSMMNESEKFAKSLKFMKLIIMIIKTYPLFSSGEKITLQKTINTNLTFMKKTALNLVKNLP